MMRIGVDSGGTFTDVLALGADGALRALKLPSTRADPSLSVIAGVRGVEEGAFAEWVHSTTVGTNALLERTGGPVALVTTSGFEDVLELRRQARPSLYALHPMVPEPLVPAERRFGLDERMAPDGSVLLAPTPEAITQLVGRVRDSGARAVAVCLLHAYANPAHERVVAAALARLGMPVAFSSEVLPVPREYERTSTTVVDAYLAPVVAPYLARIERELGPLRVMQSNGGAIRSRGAGGHPVRTLLSGPAAGVMGALAVARAVGADELITFDMGGTSTDVALVRGGRAGATDESEVAGCAIQLPMVAVHTVGAGGGSIARLDAGGALKVGPQSAGAEPGPAAYGRGGELPTVTDANLVLGRLDPSRPLGDGSVTLDEARARAAVGKLAAALGRGVEEAAEDIVAVADAVMARAIQTISVERGEDPARFTLLAFGGAGGQHACAVARELGMSRVLLPPQPGLLCAYGALGADALYDFTRMLLAETGAHVDAGALASEFSALEAEAERALDEEMIPHARRRLERSCALRYRGQSFELAVPAEGDLVAAFHAAHHERYGYAFRDRPVELVSARLRAVGESDPVPPLTVAVTGAVARMRGAEAPAERRSRLRVRFLGRAYQAEVRVRESLAVGARLSGPALVVEYSATTFLPPDAQAEVLATGALAISLSGSEPRGSANGGRST